MSENALSLFRERLGRDLTPAHHSGPTNATKHLKPAFLAVQQFVLIRGSGFVGLRLAITVGCVIAIGLILGSSAVADLISVIALTIIISRLAFKESPFAAALSVTDAALRPWLASGGQPQLDRVPLDSIGDDQWFTQAGTVRAMSAVYAALKRVFDLVVAVGLGLIVLPFVPLIALAILFESPGAIFYSQIRVGLGGRLFRIHKFRSMRQDAERDGAQFAQTNDPRVTRVGQCMRLTRVDELPQLWNVLKGEMTLVGPRPERPEFTVTLEQELPYFAKRYTMKPGLTGWAQVRYRYASTVQDYARKLEYDLYYLKHASILFDLRILLATVRVVLQKGGC